MNTCKDCAKWKKISGTPLFHGDDAGTCHRKPGGNVYTWPDATCPAFEKRRDKLDERVSEIVDAMYHVTLATKPEVLRALLDKWAAEDKEAR